MRHDSGTDPIARPMSGIPDESHSSTGVSVRQVVGRSLAAKAGKRAGWEVSGFMASKRCETWTT